MIVLVRKIAYVCVAVFALASFARADAPLENIRAEIAGILNAAERLPLPLERVRPALAA